MVMRLFFSVLIMFSMGGVSVSAPERNDINDLYRRPDRPTMQEVLPYLDQIVDEPGIPTNAAESNERIDIPRWLDILLRSAPRLIATAERLYPGATWVFLGRDSMAISDVFEAYYHTLGEKKRVVRLGVSKATFNKMSPEHLQYNFKEFFKQHGFHWNKMDDKPPFILIDAISGGFGRQGRSVMAAMYMEGMDKGKTLPFMTDRLNMLGLVVSTYKHPVKYDVSQAAEHRIKEKWMNLLTNQRPDYNQLFNEKIILTYEAEIQSANEAGYTHFIGAWHDSYGPFQKDENGKVQAKPGAEFSLVMKKSILWTQKKIWEVVRSPHFADLMQKEKMRTEALATLPQMSASQSKQLNEILLTMTRESSVATRHGTDFSFLNEQGFDYVLFNQLVNSMKQYPDYYNQFIQYLDQQLEMSDGRHVRKDSALEKLLQIHRLFKGKVCESYLRAS